MSGFEFTRDEDGQLPLESMVFQAIGAASMCWEHPERAGVFDAGRAKEIADELLRELKTHAGSPA